MKVLGHKYILMEQVGATSIGLERIEKQLRPVLIAK